MTEVRAALAADGFGVNHAVAGVTDFGDGVFFSCLAKARPAAMGVELGVGVKQLGVAAHAVVAAIFPMAFVFAGEGAFGGGFASDFKGHGFGVFGGQ